MNTVIIILHTTNPMMHKSGRSDTELAALMVATGRLHAYFRLLLVGKRTSRWVWVWRRLNINKSKQEDRKLGPYATYQLGS